MIQFACPTCKKVFKTPDTSVGRKTACPQCGQRLTVPAAQAAAKTTPNKPVPNTVLGQPVAEPTGSSLSTPPVPAAPAPVVPAGKVLVGCPGCGRSILLAQVELSWQIECAQCGQRFVPAPAPASPQRNQEEHDDSNNAQGSGHPQASRPASFGTVPAMHSRPESPDGPDDLPRFVPIRKHSGFGIASFLIAMLIGGLNLVLGIFIAVAIAASVSHPRHAGSAPGEVRDTLELGGMSIARLNLVSIPICLVGAGLGLVGLIAQRGYNHIFTWIGLIGNAVVIFGAIALNLVVLMRL